LTYETRLDRWLQRNSQHDSAIIKAERSANIIARNGIVERQIPCFQRGRVGN
jgi:hypothetical protein